VQTHINQFQAQKNGEQKTIDWEGGDKRGKLYLNDLGNGFGTLLFTLDGKPVFGTMYTPLPSSTGEPQQPPDLEAYFNDNVKPGSG
jgi:hypothetical protein